MNIKRLIRRFTCLVMALAMILTFSLTEPINAYAATLDTDISGLSASYDNGTWTASGTTFNGSATGKAKGSCDDAASETSTLTLTNNSGALALLSFDYTKPVLGSGGSVKIDGTAVTTAGSFSKELEAGKSVTVVILSGSAGAYTSSVALNNVAVTRKQNVTVTFKPAQGNGSYTVNGSQVTDTVTNTGISTEGFELAASPESGYKLEGWYSETTGRFIATSSSYKAYFETDQTVYPVFIKADTPVWEVGTQWFTDLNEAISCSTSKNISKIVLVSSGTLPAGTYTVPSGKTLLIPYDAAKTVCADKPGILESAGPGAPSAYKVLAMAEGSSVIVNGNLDVNARINSYNITYTGVTSGAYGYIKMGAGSSITLQSGSKLRCYGYISGDGLISAKPGATVYEPFQICDLRGGTATSSMNGNSSKVLPFSQYYVQNIEAEMKLEHGATEYAVGSITIQGNTTSPSAKFIGSSGALFTTSSGGAFTKKYDPSEDRVTYTVDGNASLNAISMNAFVSIDTSAYVLPLMENTSIEVVSGTTTINQDICTIPGCEFKVDSGAAIKIGSGVNAFIYDRDEWIGKGYIYSNSDLKTSYYSPSRKNADKFSPDKMADTLMDVNGTIDVSGSLYTTAGGADIMTSEGTGKVVFTKAPVSSATTHQATQEGTAISYPGIAANSAWLHNDAKYAGTDEEYTKTADSEANTEFTYNKESGKWGVWINRTVTFKDGDKTISTETVVNGNKVKKPEDPVKEGYEFLCWMNGEEEYDFETPVTEDLTLTASWKEETAEWIFSGFSWTETDDGYSVTADYVKSGDETVTRSLEASVTMDEISATCTEAGEVRYTASVGKENSLDKEAHSESKIITSDALGHDLIHHEAKEATCTEAGWNAYDTCSRCDYSTYSGIPAKGHTPVTDKAKEATCTEAGLTEGSHCSVCGTVLKAQETVPALGHDLIHHEAKAATCTEAGWNAYDTCSRCDYTTFAEIPAKGHTAVTDAAVAATCTEAGLTEGSHCSACGTVLKAQEEIPALGHDLIHHEAQRATCTEAGWNAYDTCSRCDYTTYAEIPAMGHDWKTPVWTWTGDDAKGYTGAKAVFTCNNDSTHTVEAEAADIAEARVEPTASENGSITYTAEVKGPDEKTYSDKKVVILPATGYTFKDSVYEWTETEDGFSVKAIKECNEDPSQNIVEEVSAVYDVTTPATCETAGEGTYTASFTCTDFEKQTKTETIPALGHDWGEWTVTKEATTEEEGIETRYCSNDRNHTETRPIPKKEETAGNVIRIFGASRYETAIKSADALKEQLGLDKFGSVIIACGTNYADALAGSYLSNVKKAPILLVRDRDAEIGLVKDYIKANLKEGGTIYLLGGSAVVPDRAVEGLSGYTVKRLWGNDRYETNVKILEEAGASGDEILVASGLDFADSLSASETGKPIVLVKNAIQPSQKAYVDSLKGKKFFIIGGTGAVNSDIEAYFKGLGEVTRIGGATRYETSVNVAKAFFAEPKAAVLAYGANFPDGLCGGSLANAMGGPLVLSANGKSDQAAAYAKEYGIGDGAVLGGPTLIDDSSVRTIFRMGEADEIIVK